MIRPINFLLSLVVAGSLWSGPVPAQQTELASLAPAGVTLDWRTYVHTASQTASPSVPPALIFAVIRAESSGNAKAVSPKGAQGLMQLMPDTARRFGVADSFHPEDNIKGGVAYLAELLGMFKMDPVRAVAAYNAGENRIFRYGGVPPYRETMGYTLKVMSSFISNAAPNDPLLASLDQSELLRVAREVGGTSVADRMLVRLMARHELNTAYETIPYNTPPPEIDHAAQQAAAAQAAAQLEADRIVGLQYAEMQRIQAAHAANANSTWDAVIYQDAMRMGVPIPLVKAIIAAGSGWDPRAENQHGAVGLMQLTPATARHYGAADPYDPASNIRAGIQFLAAIRASGGDETYSLALSFRQMQRGAGATDPNDDAFAQKVRTLYGAFYRRTASRGGFIKTGLN